MKPWNGPRISNGLNFTNRKRLFLRESIHQGISKMCLWWFSKSFNDGKLLVCHLPDNWNSKRLWKSICVFIFYLCVCVGSIRNSPTVYKYCILFPNLDEEPIRIDLASRRRTLPLLLVKMFRFFFLFLERIWRLRKKLKRKKEEKYCERSFTAPGGSHPSPLPY